MSGQVHRGRELPPYLVLLRVGFALPAALLPRRCALTAPFHPYPGVAAKAVCFLWHFPSTSGLNPAVPDVIRHTALRSSDFPLPASEDAGSDRPVRLPTRFIICEVGWLPSGFRLPGQLALRLGRWFCSRLRRFALLNSSSPQPCRHFQKPAEVQPIMNYRRSHPQSRCSRCGRTNFGPC